MMSQEKTATNRWAYRQKQHGPVQQAWELIMLGHDQIRKAAPLTEHAHEGCYEFVYTAVGKVRWNIGGHVYETRAGDVFHTKPSERHSGYMDVIEPCEIWWVIVKEPIETNWLGLYDDEVVRLSKSLAELPRIVSTGKQPVVPLLRMQAALDGDDAFRGLQVRSCLIEILMMILHKYEDVSLDTQLREAIYRVVDKAQSEPAWRPSARELARMANVSESHFYRMFQVAMGISPMAFIERNRMETACARLRQSDISITELALDLGFQTSQHFATVFKRHTGTTPTAWRLRYNAN